MVFPITVQGKLKIPYITEITIQLLLFLFFLFTIFFKKSKAFTKLLLIKK